MRFPSGALHCDRSITRMSKHKDRSDRTHLPVAPSMDAATASVLVPDEDTIRPTRLVRLTAMAVVLGIGGGVVAWILLALISLITHLVFRGEISTAEPVIEPGSV